jgi:hypothetical protein
MFLLCGMSQMYVINEFKSGDKTISELMDDKAAPKGVRVFGLAAPNLCNEEAMLLLLSTLSSPHTKPSVGPEEESDLFFAGAGDRDRLPYVRAAIDAGLCMRLYGIYWDRFPETQAVSRGQADIPTLRRAIAGCRVALCLVRHANRDGHSMRTFEVPAVGACMVVEDTGEHRQIFGEDGERVVYFRNAGEMVEQVRTLLANEILRKTLRDNVHLHITNGANTYADRLASTINAL